MKTTPAARMMAADPGPRPQHRRQPVGRRAGRGVHAGQHGGDAAGVELIWYLLALHPTVERRLTPNSTMCSAAATGLGRSTKARLPKAGRRRDDAPLPAANGHDAHDRQRRSSAATHPANAIVTIRRGSSIATASSGTTLTASIDRYGGHRGALTLRISPFFDRAPHLQRCAVIAGGDRHRGCESGAAFPVSPGHRPRERTGRFDQPASGPRDPGHGRATLTPFRPLAITRISAPTSAAIA